MNSVQLVVSVAEGHIQFVLVEEERILCAQQWSAVSQGTELLAPALEGALSLLGLSSTKISHIACVHGPAGFTGIRLGLATCLALAKRTDALLGALNFMNCLAHSFTPHEGQNVRVITHARHQLLYCQDFMLHPQQGPQALAAPAVLSPQALAEFSGQNPHCFIGSAVARYEPLIRSRWPKAHVYSGLFDLPSPQGLLAASRNCEWSHEPVEPLYLRSSEAEENIEQISRKLGADPAQAVTQLHTLLHGPVRNQW